MEEGTEEKLRRLKKEQRRQVLALRRQLALEEVARRSQAIWKRFLALPQVREAQTIMAYLDTRNEVQTFELISALLKMGKRVGVPITLLAEHRLIVSELVDPEEDLQTGTYGIREPRPGRERPIPPLELALIIVPGVAFDPAGGRIGYGGGFYDRFLAEMRQTSGRQKPGAPASRQPAPLVALAFELQVLERVAREPHDFLIDWIVTEERLIDCRQHRRGGGD
ncbi:MAG: 5-formyltetrahydrofolate cyclo-ligase [Firmicutes bacterium]|nr:5-formyltetrahydrofolate cyclo-ligase [Bacillota bacterium]